MIHFRLLLLAVVLAAGCAQPPPPKTTIEPKLIYQNGNYYMRVPEAVPVLSHEAQVYAELWRVCQERHLRYDVYCFSGCNAEAWDARVTRNERTEIDGFEFWMASATDRDPTLAAERLLEALKGQPNWKEKFSPYIAPPYHEPFDTGEVRP